MHYFLIFIFTIFSQASVLYKVKECHALRVESIDLEFIRQCFEINEARGFLYMIKTMGDTEHLPEMLSEFSTELSEKISNLETSREKNQIYVRILRMLNNLHEQDPLIRFSILDHLHLDQLLSIAVNWRLALYTSSFNTILDRALLLIRDGGVSLHAELILRTVENRAVLFEALSAYNRLAEVLETMTEAQVSELILSDLAYLQKAHRVRNAIAWMEYLLNPKVSDGIKQVLQHQIANMAKEQEISPSLMALYPEGSVVANPKTTSKALVALMCQTYRLMAGAPLSESCLQLEGKYKDSIAVHLDNSLDLRTLIGKDSVNVQRHVFYNDLDGRSTYHFFRKRHELLNHWQIETLPTFEIFQSTDQNTGITIQMISNLPQHYSQASVDIETYNLNTAYEPSVFVFRGHSYHVVDSLKYLNQNTMLAIVGSCGGFENLETILKQSPNTNLILTKGTGTAWINNLIVPAINKSILSGVQEIHWKEFKQNLRTELVQSMQRFPNSNHILNLFDSFYLFPHENIGFIMMRAWMQFLGDYGVKY